MKALCILPPALLVCAAPAFAHVTVSNPANGAKLASPFQLSATAAPCSSQPVTAMGYSFDDSTNTTIVNGNAINASVTSPNGAHTVHVKAWGNLGASCVTDVSITIASGSSALAAVPANAIAVIGIHALKTWQAAYDSGTGSGSASGAMALVGSPSMSGTARQFATTYTNYGGERYSVAFGKDTVASNFLYDGSFYLASPTNDVANLEIDVNQVMGNGQTVIFGFQCDGWSSTWDYTKNAGTPAQPVDTWVHSTQPCNPRNWSTNTWHHIQVLYSRDSSGNVTYKSVWFDGAKQDFNATVPSAFALSWAPTLLTNFQVDGANSTAGSATVYIDNLTVYRW
jgi:hypothetical protein